MKRVTAFILCIMMVAALFAGCGSDAGSNSKGVYDMVLSGSYTKISEVPKADLSKVDASYQNAEVKSGDVIAVMHTSMGDIKMRFFPEAAPLAVNNFIALAKAGKYNNTIFHRVINNFMIQGGDYTNFNGTGGASVYGEEFALETSPNLHNSVGAVAMANRGPDTNGSQFYINQVNNNYLDGSYTVFAQVFEGMDIVNKIAVVDTDYSDKPLTDVTLTGIEITEY